MCQSQEVFPLAHLEPFHRLRLDVVPRRAYRRGAKRCLDVVLVPLLRLRLVEGRH